MRLDPYQRVEALLKTIDKKLERATCWDQTSQTVDGRANAINELIEGLGHACQAIRILSDQTKMCDEHIGRMLPK
jgi:hypothetical protein